MEHSPVDRSEYMTMPIDQLRAEFKWGTYGIGGTQSLQYITLQQMSDAHIQAIIDDGYPAAPIMQRELDYGASIA